MNEFSKLYFKNNFIVLLRIDPLLRGDSLNISR
jgi:hypothetical protein